MVALLVFAVVLFLAVLISDIAQRSVLSTAVLFLLGGFVAGDGVLGLISLKADNPVLSRLAELALFSVLFTDGMRIGIRDLTSAWRLPGRALLLGMPLTLVAIALMAHFVAGLPWAQAFLLGAILSPTDPVFASAIVGREEIPYRLRHLLNVESGLNDGLALPVVVVMLAYTGGAKLDALKLFEELALGIVLGIAVPWLATRFMRIPHLSVAGSYEPLFAFSVGILVLSAASILHANEYLAAFSAGITMACVDSAKWRNEFHRFGELITELLKLATLLVFGALISPRFLTEIPLSGYLFILLVLFISRTVALEISLVRSQLDWRERLVASWFGPKGFASVIYGILALQAGASDSNRVFHLTALVIACSIIAHSSTDVPIAQWFRHEEGRDGQ